MYLAHIIQDDEGCGYTIGCAHSLIHLESNNYVDAMAELKKIIFGEPLENDGFINDETRLKKVTLIQIDGEFDIPLDEWIKENEVIVTEKLKAQQETVEMMEFNRLKERYGQ